MGSGSAGGREIRSVEEAGIGVPALRVLSRVTGKGSILTAGLVIGAVVAGELEIGVVEIGVLFELELGAFPAWVFWDAGWAKGCAAGCVTEGGASAALACEFGVDAAIPG